MVREKLQQKTRDENRNDAKFNLTPNVLAGARCIHDNENLSAAFNETFALRSASDMTQEETTHCVLERNEVVLCRKAPRVFFPRRPFHWRFSS